MLLMLWTTLQNFKSYNATGVVKVNVTGAPDIVIHSVNGSEPSCSAVNPCVLVTELGKVTGTGAAQVLLVVVTVTPVIVFLVWLIIQVRVGKQWSFVILFMKAAAKSSCFWEMIGHVTSLASSAVIVSTHT